MNSWDTQASCDLRSTVYEEPPQLVFLTYIARSGSTFLAHQLDSLRDVNVSLEAALPDGFVRPEFEISNVSALDGLIDALYGRRGLFSDSVDAQMAKFRYWGIDENVLRSRLMAEEWPVSFPRLLRVALDLHFVGRPAPMSVYKMGSCLGKWDTLHALFPEAKVLFIKRDPRAIYASQKRAKASTTGKSMAGCVENFSQGYRQIMNAERRVAGEEWFHHLRYEDLVNDTHGELARIAKFLGISLERHDSVTDYFSRIPQSQRHLHPLVARAPVHQRVTRWRGELPMREVKRIEIVAYDSMREDGYRFQYPVYTVIYTIARPVGRAFRLGSRRMRRLCLLAGTWLIAWSRRIFTR